MPSLSQTQYNREADMLFNLIKKVADNTGRTAMLIDNITIREKLYGVLDTLTNIDKNLAADVQALMELSIESSSDNQTVTEKFDEMRNAINIENVGRCHGTINQVRSNIEAIKDSQGSDGPDMEMLMVTYSEKDPISKALIKDPVKNSVCGHVYDRDSVSKFIDQCKKNRQLCQCPVRSCPNKQPLQMARMVSFPDFFNHVHKE